MSNTREHSLGVTHLCFRPTAWFHRWGKQGPQEMTCPGNSHQRPEPKPPDVSPALFHGSPADWQIVPTLTQVEEEGKAGWVLGPHSSWTIPIASASKLTFFPSCPYFLVGQFLFLSQVTVRLTRRFNSHSSWAIKWRFSGSKPFSGPSPPSLTDHSSSGFSSFPCRPFDR